MISVNFVLSVSIHVNIYSVTIPDETEKIVKYM